MRSLLLLLCDYVVWVLLYPELPPPIHPPNPPAGVFAGTGRPLTSGVPGRMNFEDFVFFFMSEEDKTSESALRYWFGVCDIDSDGFLTPVGALHRLPLCVCVPPTYHPTIDAHPP